MLQFGKTLYNTISNIMSGTEQSKQPELQVPFSMQFHDADRYQPSLEDVLTVKNILFTLRPDNPLPLELIDAILDLSEYWPHTTSVPIHGGITLQRPTVVGSGGPGENKLILRSLPIGALPEKNNEPVQLHLSDPVRYSTLDPKAWPKDQEIPQDATEEVRKMLGERSQIRGEFPCKKIVFKIRSHDQGWGGGRADKGTYRGSYTWFDVGLERTFATRKGRSIYPLKTSIDHLSNPQDFVLINSPEPIPSGPQYRLTDPSTHDSKSTNDIICTLRTIFPEVENNPQYNPEDIGNPNANNPVVFKHPLNPDPKILQKNKTAMIETQEYTIVWRFDDDVHPESPEADELEAQGRGRETANGDFIRALKIGDVVTIWAKARFPGWVNAVEDVSMDIYWAV